jgi:hypothetical protein
MLLIRAPFLLLLATLVSAVGVPSAARAEAVRIPSEFVAISESIHKEKSRAKRLELLGALQALTKKRVKEIPPSISEAEVLKTEVLFELDLFLGNLRNDTLNPANCARTQRSIASWSNPTGAEDDVNPTGRFVLDVVRSVCRE